MNKNLGNESGGLCFNTKTPTIMHIDLNSCFASIEQQANPLLRDIPVAVAAYSSPSGCILASSIEAKYLGIKTGMRVKDGKKICPSLKVLTPDQDKYRDVHKRLRKIMSFYTNDFSPKSIDEFVLDLKDYLSIFDKSAKEVGSEIKERITKEVGDYLRVSIGIGANRFLAKIASNLKKPNGLEEINSKNYLSAYSQMTLCDLHGINVRNEKRLNKVGIYDPLDFYAAELSRLKVAFKSILARYWYLRLRGWEIDSVEFGRKSFGNSYALPSSDGRLEELLPILSKLTDKTGSRLRKAGYKAQGVHVSLAFRDGTYWHRGKKLSRVIFDSRDIYKEAKSLLISCPKIKPVRVFAESVFYLNNDTNLQLSLIEDLVKKEKLTDSIDESNERWGSFNVGIARKLYLKHDIADRIAFGGVKELN